MPAGRKLPPVRRVRQIGPPHDIIVQSDALHFWLCQETSLSQDISAIDAWNAMMSHRLCGKVLSFQIRDAIAACFRGKRSARPSGRQASPKRGETLDYFRVMRAEPQHLTLKKRNRHLGLMLSIRTEGHTLSIATTAVTYNILGAIYLIVVAGNIHRLIVDILLHRLQKDLAAVQ